MAEHQYRMAILVQTIADPGINIKRHDLVLVRCIEIALVHDMAEAIVGDLTPDCGISKEEKMKMEKCAFDKITVLSGIPSLLEAWNEYEQDTTPEACLVKDIDKYEFLLQLVEYEKKHNIRMDDFWRNASYKIRHEEVKKWFVELENERNMLHISQ